jgi:hypothetical protein
MILTMTRCRWEAPTPTGHRRESLVGMMGMMMPVMLDQPSRTISMRSRRGLDARSATGHMTIERTGAAPDLLCDLGHGHVAARQHRFGCFDFRIIHRPGTAPNPSTGTTGSQSGTSSVDDQIPFHLPQRAEDMEQEPARGCAGADVFGQRLQRNASLLTLITEVDQVSQRSRSTVETPKDNHVSLASVFQGFCQFRPVGFGTGGCLDENPFAPRQLESIKLKIVILLVGADPGVADKHFSNLPKLIATQGNWEAGYGNEFWEAYSTLSRFITAGTRTFSKTTVFADHPKTGQRHDL